MIGRTLANYEVIDKIGEGGMGEVYRARDTTLGREVAIKVLPEHLVADPERIARFEREAKVLAALNHPGIASIYGFHEQDGVRFLAMELAPGSDLSELIGKGPIAVEDALPLASKIAEALEYAHERSIVHRDLKPSNIKISGTTIKVLDFGLARAFAPEGKDGEPTSTPTLLPTVTSGGTGAGVILGTAAYMSPEQARGHPLDRRTDIWAFGCVLYEMLTGKMLFHEDTISDTLAAVLRAEVDLSALPADTPRAVTHLLERCLDRDPSTRLRDIGEARIVLLDPSASMAMRIMAADPVPSGGGRRRAPLILTAVVALVLGMLGGKVMFTPESAPPGPSFLFDIQDTTNTLVTGSLALSPAGTHLVFSRFDEAGKRELCLRRLDQEGFRVLPGTTGGTFPFWSPDGKEIGFFVANSLYRIGLDGGAARLIADIPDRPKGGAWNAEGVILVGTNSGPLFRVLASGGVPDSLTTVEAGVENAHVWPAFLPDGEHFVFLSDASDDEGHRLYVKSLDLGESKILRKAIRSAIAIDPGGALIIIDNRQLIAFPFDFSKREISGPSLLLESDIQTLGERHESPFTVSGNGVLALQRGTDEATVMRVPLDGSPRTMLAEPDRYRNPRISRDGKRLVYEVQVSGAERLIWVHDLETGARVLASQRGVLADSPAWSADGEWLYFSSQEVGDNWFIFRKRISGGGPPEMLGRPEGSADLGFMDCASDGRSILIQSTQADGKSGLFVGDLGADSVAWHPWAVSSAVQDRGRFSPDGRWIAYRSDVSGQEEIYVSPREGGPMANQWMVSVGGGTDPAWSPDGTRLFYLTPSGVFMSVPVALSEDRIEAGRPEPVLELHSPEVGYLRNVYDPSPDGESVVAFLETARTSPAIRIRTGWRKW